MAPEEASCLRCESAMDPQPAPFETLPPRRCPFCATEIVEPAREGLLHCPRCQKDFEDHEEWVRRCRAAAFIAARPIPQPPEPPPPRPPFIRLAGASLLACAAFYAVVGFLIGRDVLIVPCIALALLQAVAGVALLTDWRHADSFVRFAAGLSTLVPIFIFPALYFVFLFWKFSSVDVVRYYGGRLDPVPDRLRHPMIAWLIVVIALVAGLYATVVAEALVTAQRWNDPLTPLLGLGERLSTFFVENRIWAPTGVFAGLCILGLWGKVSRPGFLTVATLSLVALVALGAPPVVEAHLYTKLAHEADAYLLENDQQRLIWGSREHDPKIRVAALRSLERTGRSARVAVPILTQALKDPDRRVRLAAACGLARYDPSVEGIFPVLMTALEDDRASREEADRAAIALGTTGPRARPALSLLMERFRHSDDLIPGMVEMGPAAVPGLTTALTDPDPELRRRAARTLRWIGPPARSASGALTAALKDPLPFIRAEAALALGEIQREKAIPDLKPLLRDEKTVARAAAEALCALGQRDGLSELANGSNALNALRTPALWDHLGRTVLDRDLDGTASEIIMDLGERAVLCPEVGSECADSPELQIFRRFHGALRRRTVLEVLQSLQVPFVLDSDRLRILSPDQARVFWAAWLADPSKKPE
jgi:HEAT repeat protein